MGAVSLNLAPGAGQTRADGADRDAERRCCVCVRELAPQDEEDDVLFSLGERRYRFQSACNCPSCPEAFHRVLFGTRTVRRVRNAIERRSITSQRAISVSNCVVGHTD